MSGVPSANTSRVPTMILSPYSLALEWTRTTPATELRSATPRPASPRFFAASTSSSGCDAPRRKEKLVATASSAYASTTQPLVKRLRKHAMQEPARLSNLAPVDAFAIEPDAGAGFAFDAEIIAGERHALGVVPPFHGDALRTFRARHFMQDMSPAKAQRRAFRHFGDDL